MVPAGRKAAALSRIQLPHFLFSIRHLFQPVIILLKRQGCLCHIHGAKPGFHRPDRGIFL